MAVIQPHRASTGTRWSRFSSWRRERPFVGGILTVIAGVEMFFSGQLDFGHIHVQLGIEGFQATVIPILLVVLGVLAITMPMHRVFYGVISLVVSVYALIGDNLGGFFIGMLLGAVGGILTVSWMPRKDDSDTNAGDAPAPKTLVSESLAPESLVPQSTDADISQTRREPIPGNQP